MHHTPTKSDEPIDTSHGYETRDVSLPVITKWVIFLLVFVAVMTAVTWPIYAVFVPHNTVVGQTTPLAEARVLPPEPRLQAYPKTEMKDFRLDEDRKVGGYGWADKATGKVRIPVERAMELTVERGFSEHTGTPGPESQGPHTEPAGGAAPNLGQAAPTTERGNQAVTPPTATGGQETIPANPATGGGTAPSAPLDQQAQPGTSQPGAAQPGPH